MDGYRAVVRKVGLRALKNELSKCVRLAARGETVLITDGERVVARIVPPERNYRSLTDEEFLDAAASDGWIRRATDRSRKPPPRGPTVMTLAQLLADLDRARADC